jgi:peptidoglycan-associated lipoprotein
MPFGKDDEAADKQAAQVEDRTGDGAATSGAGAGTFTGDPLDDPGSLLSKRVVYFDFDSSSIREDSRAIIEAHARYLASKPGASVVLEGHADERGTREYNIALGERRANSVRQLMVLNGVASGQIQTVSYGEERPVATGHSETAWNLNRRVEIVYAR